MDEHLTDDLALPAGEAVSEQRLIVEARLARGTGDGSPLRLLPPFAEPDDSVLPARLHDLELATLPYAVFVIAATGRIEDANPFAEMLLGYGRDELVGHRMDLLISSIARPRSSRVANDRVWFVPAETGASARHRCGREMPVEVTMCPHDRGSSIAIVRALGDDRLGLREVDVAQIVHDLKNPLATMSLETCLLDDNLARGDQTGARSAVARITRNIEFLDRMVEDLLDSCSIDAGHFEIHRQPTELRAMIERVVERTVATRDRDRVTVVALHPIVLAIDDLRIERVIANLLGNALKYAPRGPITVRLERTETVARLSVTDSGPGLTSPEMAYVFDKYRRATAAHGLTGNGLGLYVSKKIVETHGGLIGVDSVPGDGSRFYFELPTT